MATATSNARLIDGRLIDRRLIAAMAATAMLVVSGCVGPTGGGSGTTAPAPRGQAFAWFRAGPAPGLWKVEELPDRTAKMSLPPEATPAQADPGSVSAEITSPSAGLLVYFNATPKQGDESVATWPEFRLDHLVDENGEPAQKLSSRTGMAFRGGQGSCVEDTYRTRDSEGGTHDYREIACFVEGARGGSVLVVATPPQAWDAYSSVVQQAVDAYAAE